MASTRQNADPASTSGGVRRHDDEASVAGDRDRPTVHSRWERPLVDPAQDESAPEPGARFLSDSGRSGDEVRLVYLRGAAGTVSRGAVRGPLPASLTVLGEDYELSRFSQVDARGAVVSTYRASTGERSSYR